MFQRGGLIMDMQTSNDSRVAVKPKRNWWKLAFFVALIAFELAREFAVLASASGPTPNASHMVFAHGPTGSRFVSATGRWVRNDDGGKLVPATVRIECREELGQCIEATTTILDDSVFPPELDFFEAQFGPELVTYINDEPVCARYTVRVDLKLQQVFALRERKSAAGDCAHLEPRLASKLAGPPKAEEYRAEQEEHFVPLISLISALF